MSIIFKYTEYVFKTGWLQFIITSVVMWLNDYSKYFQKSIPFQNLCEGGLENLQACRHETHPASEKDPGSPTGRDIWE